MIFSSSPQWEGLWIGGKYIIVLSWGTNERVKEMMAVSSESLGCFHILQLRSFLICAIELKRRKDLLHSCLVCTPQNKTSIHFSCSVVSDSATPWIAACQASLSITNSWSLLKLMSIELVMPSSHLILCHPLLLLPPIPPSIRVFSNESTLPMRRPKYWSFISPSSEHPGLISFRMDWLYLLVVQGTLKSLLHHHCLKASIL